MAEETGEFDFSSEDEVEDENSWKYDEKGHEISRTDTYNSVLNADRNENVKREVERATEKKISRMDLNTSKAGMEGLDREKINQIILEASKGSRFYENERKKEKQVLKRIEELQKKMSLLTPEEKFKARQDMDKIVEELENNRDLSRTIVHVDMDAFYAAVEMRDDPSLKSKPMAVGNNAMLCTSNYLARRFGVRAGMPGFIAKKLCPQLVIVPTNFEKYTKISEEIRTIMAQYDPNYLPMSLDEAYLDITQFLNALRKAREEAASKFEGDMRRSKEIEGFYGGVEKGGETVGRERDDGEDSGSLKRSRCKDGEAKLESLDPAGEDRDPGEVDGKNAFGSNDSAEEQGQTEQKEVEQIVQEMRGKIEEQTQLTASAGIAPNMFLAKVCSDKNKPNGQFYLKPERNAIMEFVRKLPLRKAFGIGRVSEQVLTSVLTISTCAELYDKRALICLLFTPTACRSYLEISLGLGSTVVYVNRERKSMSTETTFREINKAEEHFSKCYELCRELSRSLKNERLLARKIGVKLKTVNFEVKTRICSASNAVQETDEIFSYAKKLISNETRACHPRPLRLRLMGVRAAELCHADDIMKECKQLTITKLLKQNGNAQVCSQVKSSGGSLLSNKAGISADHSCDKTRSLEMPGEHVSLQHVEKVTEDEGKLVNLSHSAPLHNVECETDTISGQPNTASHEVDQQENTTVVCPVCGQNLSFSSSSALVQFNNHMDTCLNRQAIADLLKQDSAKDVNGEQPRQPQSSKKRKRDSPNAKGKRRTLDYYLTK